MTSGVRLAVTLAYSAWHFQLLTFPPRPASWAPMAFISATRGGRAEASGSTWAATVVATATASGRAEARGDGIIIAGVIATWGGRCPLSIGAAVAEAAVGRRRRQECPWRGGGQCRRHGHRGLRRPALHVEGGSDQIFCVPHQIRGGEAAVGDERLRI
jgi:hypothetical protein